MAAPVPTIIVDRPTSPVARSGFFLLHTIAMYVCAVFFSPRLVSAWFNWVSPLLHLESGAFPADWYLQHLVIVTIVPALVVGYVNVRGANSMGPWAWAVPTLILAFKMVTYSSTGSVLDGDRLSAFQYFFDIQQVMPTFTNHLGKRSSPCTCPNECDGTFLCWCLVRVWGRYSQSDTFSGHYLRLEVPTNRNKGLSGASFQEL